MFIYTRDGRRREMWLGSYGSGTGHVSLVDARAKANEVRSILGRGGDPFTEMGERKALASKVTFEAVVAQFLGTMESSWRNEKHRAQWRMTLGPSYCGPILKKPIGAIDTIAVLKALSPIWETKNETATRVRGRIEKVIDHATAKGLRTGDNPARWKGHLDHLLPSVTKMVCGHHAAMPYSEVPAFMTRLRGMMGDSARALELTVLTAGRTGEVLGAKWPEFDLDAAVWTVPADRMKAGREHRVPLGPAAVAVIERQASLRRSEYVFPGQSGRKPLSNMAMVSLLRRMDLSHFTVHGFRSAFRDWAAEETEVPREIAEAALAHVVGDATERAYRRGDALERRRVLMIEWERHCGDADG